MIRKMLQTALCLALCPVLVAQQLLAEAVNSDASQTSMPAPATTTSPSLAKLVTIPKDTAIKYRLLDAISSVTYKRGDVIRCLVAEDVIVNGITVLPRGTIVPAIITKAQRAIPGKRDGGLDFRPANIEMGKNFRLRITDDVSKSPEERKENGKDVLEIVATAPLWIPMFPVFVIGYAIADRDDGSCKSCKPTGKDFVFDACFEMTFYVKSSKTFRVVDLPAAPANSAAADSSCKLTPASAKGVPVAP